MPQMAPLNWITLFFSFSMIFILMNSSNYFFFKYNPNLSSKSYKLNNNNWKW